VNLSYLQENLRLYLLC